MLQSYYLKDLDTYVQLELRDGTSDEKSANDVLLRKSYARHGFTPAAGELWLDLGVNIGAFSIWAAVHGASAIGWEPEPECYAQALANLERNSLAPMVDLRNAAVWPYSGFEVSLSVNSARGNVWRSSLFKDWQGGHQIMVPTESIEEFWTPDVCVKMDIEGTEATILEAFGHRPVRKLVFEYSFDILPDMARFKRIMETLRNTYENVRGGPGAKQLAEEKWITHGPANGVNVFCW